VVHNRISLPADFNVFFAKVFTHHSTANSTTSFATTFSHVLIANFVHHFATHFNNVHHHQNVNISNGILIKPIPPLIRLSLVDNSLPFKSVQSIATHISYAHHKTGTILIQKSATSKEVSLSVFFVPSALSCDHTHHNIRACKPTPIIRPVLPGIFRLANPPFASTILFTIGLVYNFCFSTQLALLKCCIIDFSLCAIDVLCCAIQSINFLFFAYCSLARTCCDRALYAGVHFCIDFVFANLFTVVSNVENTFLVSLAASFVALSISFVKLSIFLLRISIFFVLGNIFLPALSSLSN
jgi:hypothetical protein